MIQVIKERVEGGHYAVDPRAVAEAMLVHRGRGEQLRSLWSEVLVAPQALAQAAERDALTGLDAS